MQPEQYIIMQLPFKAPLIREALKGPFRELEMPEKRLRHRLFKELSNPPIQQVPGQERRLLVWEEERAVMARKEPVGWQASSGGGSRLPTEPVKFRA